MVRVAWKADAVAHIVRSMFAMTLCIRKSKCPDTPCAEGRCHGTCRLEYLCHDTLHPEGKMP